MVVSKPLVFTASTASLKDLVCHKTGKIKKEFLSLLRGVEQHANTKGEKIEEALAELEAGGIASSDGGGEDYRGDSCVITIKRCGNTEKWTFNDEELELF